MNINDYQQDYYENEWSKIKLSDVPGKSGWRTTVPAPDFVDFIAYLKNNDVFGKALDLGCGAGRHSILLAQNGFDVSGIDFAEAAIVQARINASKTEARAKTDFQVGNVLNLPYEDHSFDMVNDDGCLHHIDPLQWPLYLANVTRVMKTNGILRIKAFSKNCPYFEKSTGNNSSQWIKLTSSGFTYFFNDEDIRQLFSDKFEIISIKEEAHTETNEKRFFFAVLKLRN